MLARLGVFRVVNPRYHEEMFTSVKAGAAALDGKVEAFSLHPGDVPFVRPATLKRMLKAWQILDEKCDDPGILTDLDTADDYGRALRRSDPTTPEPPSPTGR